MSRFFMHTPGRGLMGAALAAILAVAQPGWAEGISFAGQQIESVTPSGTGGSGDAYLRFFEPWYGKYLPGEPTVLVRNMPGGGAMIGTNWFATKAANDGSVYFVFSIGSMFKYLLESEDPVIQYDPMAWTAFIASPMGRVTYVHPSTGITSVEDLRDFDGTLTMAIQAVTGSDLPTMMALELLGPEVKAIVGLDGGEKSLAYQRGELNVNTDITSAFLTNGADLVASGEAIPLFSFGYENEEGEIVRDPNFPDIPSWPEAYEIVHGKKPDGPAYEAWLSMFRISVMASKALVLPKDTPQEVIDAYWQASERIVADPAFAARAEAAIGAYPQTFGAVADERRRASLKLSEDAKSFIKAWVRENLNVDL
ncbi:tricarboxylate transporter [Salipiger sp.]|uniref:tricarboxylate transporter n=1 Tax=Salipiger sp. TaxID=2078585 RepID=UPI003A97A858